MGWLEDLAKERVFKYRIEGDEESFVQGTTEELQRYFEQYPSFEGLLLCEPGEKLHLFNVDEETGEQYGEPQIWVYSGFEPIKSGIMTKITFEKNGRKALRVTHGNGKSTVRSMSRENLLKGKGVKETGFKHDASGQRTGKKSYEVESILTRGCSDATNKEKEKRVIQQVKGVRHEIAKQTHLAKEKKKGKK